MIGRTAMILLIALLFTAPPSLAGGSYARNATLVTEFSTPAAADAHVYTVNAHAGDVITVRVTWDAQADLDIYFVRPDTLQCALIVPDAPCHLQRDNLCQEQPAPLGLGPATETRVVTVTATGAHDFSIRAAAALPGSIPYRVEILTEGQGGEVGGPFAARYVAGQVACKAALV